MWKAGPWRDLVHVACLASALFAREVGMKTVTFPAGLVQPALGLGTWRMGESRRARRSAVAAVRSALEMGYRVIATAEMYGEGGAEEVIGAALSEALRGSTLRREDVYIVSKAYPHHASRRELPAACER